MLTKQISYLVIISFSSNELFVKIKYVMILESVSILDFKLLFHNDWFWFLFSPFLFLASFSSVENVTEEELSTYYFNLIKNLPNDLYMSEISKVKLKKDFPSPVHWNWNWNCNDMVFPHAWCFFAFRFYDFHSNESKSTSIQIACVLFMWQGIRWLECVISVWQHLKQDCQWPLGKSINIHSYSKRYFFCSSFDIHSFQWIDERTSNWSGRVLASALITDCVCIYLSIYRSFLFVDVICFGIFPNRVISA